MRHRSGGTDGTPVAPVNGDEGRWRPEEDFVSGGEVKTDLLRADATRLRSVQEKVVERLLQKSREKITCTFYIIILFEIQ